MELSILVHESFKEGNQMDLFLADLHKAFDVIRSVRMVRKLSDSRFRLCNALLLWFRSFFHNRKQVVRISSCESEEIDVFSGVVQGSNLAAILFLVYFNDSDGTAGVTYDI